MCLFWISFSSQPMISSIKDSHVTGTLFWQYGSRGLQQEFRVLPGSLDNLLRNDYATQVVCRDSHFVQAAQPICKIISAVSRANVFLKSLLNQARRLLVRPRFAPSGRR